MLSMNLQFFGGRGSTSGGASGGMNAGNIVSTQSLLSASGKQSEINSVLDAVKSVYDNYGVDLSDIQIATLDGKGKSTLAYYDSQGNLAINDTFFDSKSMNNAYDNSVKSGFHPPRGNKSGLEAVAAHELGHALTEEVGRRLGMGDWAVDKAANQIMKDAKARLGAKSTADVRGKVSGYAASNNAEGVAEAFADVHCNGKKAKRESREIVGALDRLLGGKKNG